MDNSFDKKQSIRVFVALIISCIPVVAHADTGAEPFLFSIGGAIWNWLFGAQTAKDDAWFYLTAWPFIMAAIVWSHASFRNGLAQIGRFSICLFALFGLPWIVVSSLIHFLFGTALAAANAIPWVGWLVGGLAEFAFELLSGLVTALIVLFYYVVVERKARLVTGKLWGWLDPHRIGKNDDTGSIGRAFASVLAGFGAHFLYTMMAHPIAADATTFFDIKDQDMPLSILIPVSWGAWILVWRLGFRRPMIDKAAYKEKKNAPCTSYIPKSKRDIGSTNWRRFKKCLDSINLKENGDKMNSCSSVNCKGHLGIKWYCIECGATNDGEDDACQTENCASKGRPPTKNLLNVPSIPDWLYLQFKKGVRVCFYCGKEHKNLKAEWCSKCDTNLNTHLQRPGLPPRNPVSAAAAATGVPGATPNPLAPGVPGATPNPLAPGVPGAGVAGTGLGMQDLKDLLMIKALSNLATPAGTPSSAPPPKKGKPLKFCLNPACETKMSEGPNRCHDCGEPLGVKPKGKKKPVTTPPSTGGGSTGGKKRVIRPPSI